jgi:hypothetical protein
MWHSYLIINYWTEQTTVWCYPQKLHIASFSSSPHCRALFTYGWFYTKYQFLIDTCHNHPHEGLVQSVPVYHITTLYPHTLRIHSPMKMEQTQCSETSVIKHHTPENYPKDHTRQNTNFLYIGQFKLPNLKKFCIIFKFTFTKTYHK